MRPGELGGSLKCQDCVVTGSLGICGVRAYPYETLIEHSHNDHITPCSRMRGAG